MDCAVIFYISYKTGYIQRILSKKFRESDEITIASSVAAVAPEDMRDKFSQSLENNNLIFVIGGLSAAADRNVMTVLSDYFTDNEMDVDFNKKIMNPCGGKDGYLIKSGEKYIAVLPDEPDHIETMIGSELMKNIEIIQTPTQPEPEPEKKHTIVFAPEPDDTLDKINKKRSPNLFLKICIAVGIVTVLCAAVWIIAELMGF